VLTSKRYENTLFLPFITNQHRSLDLIYLPEMILGYVITPYYFRQMIECVILLNHDDTHRKPAVLVPSFDRQI
jgi:hypothetical protein